MKILPLKTGVIALAVFTGLSLRAVKVTVFAAARLADSLQQIATDYK